MRSEVTPPTRHRSSPWNWLTRRARRLPIPVQRGLLFATATLAAVTLHWIATTSEHLLTEPHVGPPSPANHPAATNAPPGALSPAPPPTATTRALVPPEGLLGTAVAGFLLCSGAVYLLRHAVTGPRLRSFHLASTHPRSVLVILVSPEDFRTGKPRLAEPTQETPSRWMLDGTEYFDTGSLTQLPSAGQRLALAKTQASRNPQWPWQQTLRAIEPHLEADVLREVWLVGSPGAKGSFRELPRLRRLLETVLGAGVRVRLEGQDCPPLPEAVQPYAGVGFEDYNSLVRCLTHLFEHVTGEGGRQLADIALDVTGGVKTASVAAASATLNCDAVFQYVQTSGSFEVLTYDVQYTTPWQSSDH